MADFDTIGKQFVAQYYTIFDTARESLAPLYREQSMLSFEGAQVQGQQAIMQKLLNLSFGTVQHRIDPSTIDVQPSLNGSVIVLASGDLIVDSAVDKPLKFSEVFHLVPANDGWWCFNDIFRLNLTG